MPRGRSGGSRQGTPGKGYSNRTDLMGNYNATMNTAATGGLTPPAQVASSSPAAAQAPRLQQRGPLIGADEVPNLSDPTMRPNEPVTAGLSVGPGAGPAALGPMPPSPADPVRQAIETLMMIGPNPDLVRILGRLDLEGR